MKAKYPSSLLLACALALLLAGCAGSPATQPLKPPAGAADVAATFGTAGDDARLAVRLTIPGVTGGLRTQDLPPSFDHADIRLAGPLLASPNPRQVTRALGEFTSPAPAATDIAGDGVGALLDGTGTGARFFFPAEIERAPDGNLFVADFNNHAVRKVTPGGVVTTVAGDGTVGTLDGTGTGARFNKPFGLALDDDGNLYVSDNGSHRIRKISPGGVVTTLAGSLAGSQDGTGTGARFNSPGDIALDPHGNLIVADSGNHRLRHITPEGEVTTLAGSGSPGTADGTGTNASFNTPLHLTVAPDGTIFVSDTYNFLVRQVTANGEVSTLAGDGTAGNVDGTGHGARFDRPRGILLDGLGNLLLATEDAGNIRRIAPGGVVTSLTGAILNHPHGIAFDRTTGTIFAANTNFHKISKVTFPARSSTTVFTNLRPGDGYRLEVSLYDDSAPTNRVLAAGSHGPFSLAAGSNLQLVTLGLGDAVELPPLLPLTFSNIFNNATGNDSGKPLSTVVVLGDSLLIKPGVGDPNAQLRAIRLWLDGTAGADFTDGKLLAVWFPDAFSSVFTWDTNMDPVSTGIFGTPTFTVTPQAVPQPSAMAAEGTPNHRLTFTLHDRFSPPGNDLIRVVTYPLTVLSPANFDLGLFIQGRQQP